MARRSLVATTSARLLQNSRLSAPASPSTRARPTASRTFVSSNHLSSAAGPSSEPLPPPSATPELLRGLRDLLKSYPVFEEASWPARLDKTLVDLEQQRNARIAVVGDAQSGASALVTGAFDEPLEGDVSMALASRRLGESPEAIKIFYSPETKGGVDELGIPSHWLKENQAEVLEIVHGDVAPLQSSLGLMYTSDSIVLLVSEQHSIIPSNLKDLLREMAGKPNLILVVNTETPPSALHHLQLQLQALLPNEADHPAVFAVSTSQAMDALLALTPDDPATPPAFEDFQAGYVRSGISLLKDLLSQSVGSLKTPSSERGVPSALQLQTAQFVLDKAVNSAGFAAAQVDGALEAASSEIATLAFKADEAEKKALVELNIVDGRLEVPRESLALAQQELQELLSGPISWWKLPFRSDDITAEIAFTVDTAYLRPFEEKIIFKTGSLLSLLKEMSTETDQLLKTSPAFSPHSPSTTSLHSPLLTNLLQRTQAESLPISSDALSSFIVKRRNQISSPGGPAEVLQARAQVAVASASVLAGSSMGAAVVSDLLAYAEFATNAGFGLFGSVLAAWLLQRRWDKAKRRFFVDVEKRVTGGLEDDLGLAAQKTIDSALLKTRKAVTEATKILQSRQKELGTFTSKLASIERRRKELGKSN